jgi:hypothetical protein
MLKIKCLYIYFLWYDKNIGVFVMKLKFSNLIWGVFFLLAATFILFNQFDHFFNIGIGSIIVSILALLIIVQCIAHLRFAALPIPIAVLYVIFQTPLDLQQYRQKY